MAEEPVPKIRVDHRCPPDMVFAVDGEVIVGALNTRTGVTLGTEDIRRIGGGAVGTPEVPPAPPPPWHAAIKRLMAARKASLRARLDKHAPDTRWIDD